MDGGNGPGERRREERDYVQEVKCGWQDTAGRRKHSEHCKAISWSMLQASTLQVRNRGNVCLSFYKSRLFFSSCPGCRWKSVGKTNINLAAASKANKTSRCSRYLILFRMTDLYHKGDFQWQPRYLKDFMLLNVTIIGKIINPDKAIRRLLHHFKFKWS